MPNAEQRVETPPIQQAETRGEPYPNTTLGVLRRLKELALENNLVGIQTENDIVVSKLLEIVEEGTRNLKRWAENSGKPWEGKVSYSYLPREQDGAAFWSGEGVEIGEKSLLIFQYTNRAVYNPSISDEQRIETRVSHDFKRLYSVKFTEVKTFYEIPQVIESIKVSFRNNQLLGLSFVESTQIPSGIGSFYERPLGPVRELRIKFLA